MAQARYLYSVLASKVGAYHHCLKSGNDAVGHHEQDIERLVKEHMPSGSGFDAGTFIDMSASHADKLVFTTSYHHMNDVGFYDGWTEHTVTVTPSFHGIHVRVSGRNRNDIKDYVTECFHADLETEVTE